MNAPDTLAPVAISPVESIVADMRAGRIVILVDEEDRENEGDLVLAADHVTPEAINFMARFGRGLICLTLTKDRCERLNLPPMVPRNGTKMGTAFTISIEAAEGVTTGISAADRARTVQVAVAPNAQAADLVQPGHIFPLQAQPGGVLNRAGHTEAASDLALLAGLEPSGVLVEILNADGSMARRPQLEAFAKEHGLKIGSIEELIRHRLETEHTVERVDRRAIETDHGPFELQTYRDRLTRGLHYALVRGDDGLMRAAPGTALAPANGPSLVAGAVAAQEAGADLAQRLTALDANAELSGMAAYERLQARQALESLATAGSRGREGAHYVAERRVRIAEVAAGTAAAQREIDRLERERALDLKRRLAAKLLQWLQMEPQE